jgi:NADPH-dependent curcumin reductase CurA
VRFSLCICSLPLPNRHDNAENEIIINPTDKLRFHFPKKKETAAMDKKSNRRVTLATRPAGAPVPENFRLVEGEIPSPGEGQMLLRTLYLSLDPYMRGRMNDAPSYAPPVAIDEVMVGGTVSRVVQSGVEGFDPGDLVLSANGWQDYAISDGTGVMPIHSNAAHPISYYLGVLGMPGHTAYHGLLEIGRPRAGETVVVPAAAGAVGSVVGQIAKIEGCRVVGVAGSAEKCRFVVETLGFDHCVNYKDDDFKTRLQAACPEGVDVYFESVGGIVQQVVWPLLNVGARVPVCGTIAHYNATELPSGPDRSPLLMREILVKRLSVQGFIIFDHQKQFPAMSAAIGGWLSEGRLLYREDVVDGLEQAPEAFIGLLEGRNFGKLVVKVADPA